MRTARTKAILAGILISSIGILTACSDDDAGNAPPAQTYPTSLSYHSITDTELMLWVGGVEINTEDMAASELFDDWTWELMDESYWEGNTFVFNSDSVFSADLSEGAPYYFSNDSLFVSVSSVSGADTLESLLFIGTGDLNEFRIDQGTASYCASFGSGSSCGGFGENIYLTLQDALQEFPINAVDEMGANDSLIVYNQKVVFRP